MLLHSAQVFWVTGSRACGPTRHLSIYCRSGHNMTTLLVDKLSDHASALYLTYIRCFPNILAEPSLRNMMFLIELPMPPRYLYRRPEPKCHKVDGLCPVAHAWAARLCLLEPLPLRCGLELNRPHFARHVSMLARPPAVQDAWCTLRFSSNSPHALQFIGRTCKSHSVTLDGCPKSSDLTGIYDKACRISLLWLCWLV